ncbi:MAG: PilZ domain-containing protein [Dongiaceae bacterium]
MRVLAFASQKSGAGKTTLAGHMAVQAQQGGIANVALIDIDPEASLADWCAQRGEQPVKYARATQADLLQKIESLRADGTDLVVIDTPAALGQSIEAALVVADLIAIPARPCAHDLDAASAIVELVQLSGKPFVFVINGVEANAELPPEVVMTLAQHGPVATAAIPRSIAFVESMMDGRTVMEISGELSPSGNVQKLWEYFAKRLPKAGDAAVAAPKPADIAPPPAASEPGKPAGDLFSSKTAGKGESSPASAFQAGMAAAAESAPAAAPAASLAAAPAPASDGGEQSSPEAMRKYPRFVYDRPAKIKLGDKEYDCVVHDISAGGALIMANLPFKVGDVVFLKLESIDDLTSEVRHREEDRVGLRFKIEPRQQLSLVKSLSAMVQAGTGRRA